MSYSLEHLAMLATARGEPEAAEKHLDASQSLHSSRERALTARVRNLKADIRRAPGRHDGAEQWSRLALQQVLHQSGYPVAMDGLAGLRQSSLAWGETAQAVRLLAHEAAHRTTEFATRHRAQRLLALAAQQLRPEAYQQAVAWGQDSSLETLCALYLALASSASQTSASPLLPRNT